VEAEAEAEVVARAEEATAKEEGGRAMEVKVEAESMAVEVEAEAEAEVEARAEEATAKEEGGRAMVAQAAAEMTAA